MIWLLFFLAWSGNDVEWSERQFRSHIRFLASNALEGRDTTYQGQKAAAQYIAAHFRRHSVPPAWSEEEGGYFQTYQLAVTETDQASLSLKLRGRGESLSLVHGRDYSFFTPRLVDFSERAPMAFVGYGVVNDDYSDYADVDLEGHWAVMFAGRPEGEGPLLGQDDLSGDNTWEKIMKAMGQGATGVVFLLDESYTGDENGRAQSSMGLPDKTRERGECFPIIQIPANGRDAFLGKYAKRIGKASELIEKTEKPQAFVMKGRTMDFTARYTRTLKSAENVVAVLPGSDPILKDEYVVVSAHYDHVGVMGGEIYNGADDNASGTAAVMMMGQRFQQMSHRRSLILLLVSGEEHGLLGSEHFMTKPCVPAENIVANINFDMVGRPKDGLGIIPSKNDDVTTLNDLVRKINDEKRYNLTLLDTMDRYHTRSDHYNFVEKGVPAIFFFSGMHEDYHQPTDDWDKIQYAELSHFYYLFEDFARAVLDQDQRPQWLRDLKKEEDQAEASDGKDKNASGM